jgi:hypothetical protein
MLELVDDCSRNMSPVKSTLQNRPFKLLSLGMYAIQKRASQPRGPLPFRHPELYRYIYDGVYATFLIGFESAQLVS